jgi:hypothetical protein
MRRIAIVAAGLVAALAAPAFAEDNMMGMMQGGEVMSFMGDGHMGKAMVTDQAMLDSMMKMATPIDGCLIIMTGPDGKTYMVKPTTKDEMALCEKMAM